MWITAFSFYEDKTCTYCLKLYVKTANLVLKLSIIGP